MNDAYFPDNIFAINYQNCFRNNKVMVKIRTGCFFETQSERRTMVRLWPCSLYTNNTRTQFADRVVDTVMV